MSNMKDMHILDMIKEVYGEGYERVRCQDGYSISVQAGAHKYCTPRNNHGPYTEVELGFPSAPDSMLNGYIESTTEPPTDSVYPYVPVSVVRDLIIKHGGALEGTVPPGVLMFFADGTNNRIYADNGEEEE